MEQNKKLEEMRNLIVDELYDCDRYNGIDTCSYCKIKGEQGECTIAEKIAERLNEAGYSKSVKFEKSGDFDKVVEENKKLKEDRERLIGTLEAQYTYKTTQNGLCDVFEIVRRLAVKEVKKENDKLKKQIVSLEEEIENLKIQLEQANCGIVQCGGCELVRLNTVKEFAEKLKDKFNGYEATSYNGYEEGWHDLQEEIDELLKEYGVEL
ncbi:MAG: hypothetical protein KBS91_02420 [Firmicutes bacterium]|nr:hypothetical protein [Candidatus Caballimonas caccae]